MRNEFINKVYEKLNPVINSWVVENENCGKVVSYNNIFRSEPDYEDYWGVKIVCKNDYHISFRFYTVVGVGINNKVKIFKVEVDGPAIMCSSSYSISLGYYIPTTTDTFSNRSWISFSEGQFDVDDDSWVDDVLEYLNKWVNEDKANIEGLK